MSGHKPAWWLLYLSVPFLIGLLVLDQELLFSLLGHQIVQLGIVIVFFGLIILWLRSNSPALVRKSRPNALSLIITVYDPSAEERRQVNEHKKELEKAA